MKEITSSYPNKFYKSKHQRFKNDIICSCKCDCDMILTLLEPQLKKGEKCYCCSEGDHAYPVYKSKEILVKSNLITECNNCKKGYHHLCSTASCTCTDPSHKIQTVEDVQL